MNRTTIMLPSALKASALLKARERGISFGELVRQSLALLLADAPVREGDSLLADLAVYQGPAPSDLSANHDSHLYDGE